MAGRIVNLGQKPLRVIEQQSLPSTIVHSGTGTDVKNVNLIINSGVHCIAHTRDKILLILYLDTF